MINLILLYNYQQKEDSMIILIAFFTGLLTLAGIGLFYGLIFTLRNFKKRELKKKIAYWSVSLFTLVYMLSLGCYYIWNMNVARVTIVNKIGVPIKNLKVLHTRKKLKCLMPNEKVTFWFIKNSSGVAISFKIKNQIFIEPILCRNDASRREYELGIDSPCWKCSHGYEKKYLK